MHQTSVLFASYLYSAQQIFDLGILVMSVLQKGKPSQEKFLVAFNPWSRWLLTTALQRASYVLCLSQVLILSRPSLFSLKYEKHDRSAVPDEELRSPPQLVNMLISQEKPSFLAFFLEPKDRHFVISCDHLFLQAWLIPCLYFTGIFVTTPSPLLTPSCDQRPSSHPLHLSFYNLSSLASCLWGRAGFFRCCLLHFIRIICIVPSKLVLLFEAPIFLESPFVLITHFFF